MKAQKLCKIALQHYNNRLVPVRREDGGVRSCLYEVEREETVIGYQQNIEHRRYNKKRNRETLVW